MGDYSTVRFNNVFHTCLYLLLVAYVPSSLAFRFCFHRPSQLFTTLEMATPITTMAVRMVVIR